jgi:hypothetical protein
VNQSALLDHGWRILGWVLTGQDGRYFFAPIRVIPRNGVVMSTPPVSLPVPSIERNAIPAWYAVVRRQLIESHFSTPEEFVPELQSFTLSPCFAAPLPIAKQ